MKWFVGSDVMKGSALAIVSCVTCLGLAGCATIQPGARSGYTADLSDDDISPQTLPVKRKIKAPVYVVLTPEAVQDAMDLKNTPHSVTGFRGFFERGFVQVLSPYFETVHFIEDPDVLPNGAYYVLDVVVQKLEGQSTIAGGMEYVILNLQWTAGLQVSGQEDYIYSFSGRAPSHNTYRTLDIGMQQTLANAMSGFGEGWADKNVYKTLIELEGGS